MHTPTRPGTHMHARTQAQVYTHRPLYNTYCFSTVTMVSRTHLNVNVIRTLAVLLFINNNVAKNRSYAVECLRILPFLRLLVEVLDAFLQNSALESHFALRDARLTRKICFEITP
jgi:hypothetical protein